MAANGEARRTEAGRCGTAAGTQSTLANAGRAIGEDHHAGRIGGTGAAYGCRKRNTLSPDGGVGGGEDGGGGAGLGDGLGHGGGGATAEGRVAAVAGRDGMGTRGERGRAEGSGG